ncbi:glycosyltransferase, partial [Azospirillum brasilense]|uniref:glycosyltransferase n=1 Tax=Azospirillum brasilense TaxID=192 RepID=UPI00190B7B63
MSSPKTPKPDSGALERAIADGRWAEAEREARALLRDDRSHINGATGMARCAVARGDLGEALRWAERSARFAPNDIALKAFLAALLVAADRSSDVPPLLEAVAERAPTPTASIVLGQALARLDAMDRFIPLVERLLQRFPVGVAPLLADLADHAARSGAAMGWASADLGLRIVGALRPDRTGAGSVLRIASDRGPCLVLDGPSFLQRHGQPDPAAGLVRFSLPLGPETEGETLSVTLDGRPLLGAPLQPRRCAAVEGSAVLEDAPDGTTRLSGWAWCPGDPPQRVAVQVRDSAGHSITLATDQPMEAAHAFGIEDGDYAFTLDLNGSGLAVGPLRVTAGPGEVPLAGSPLPWPGPGRPPFRPSPVGPIPARPPGGSSRGRPADPVVDVIIPVYRGREETLACLRSVFAAAREDGTPHEVIVVDDAGPEPDLSRDLAALAGEGRITLLRNERNLGFPATVNRGLRLHPDRDVVLLNADTLVAGDWLARLRAAAHASDDIGTVTPLSNDATILSYPSGKDRPPPPSPAGAARLDRQARAVNAGLRVELPTAVGFCMYIRRDCLAETGPFEELLFGRGYGEENDFCLRARGLGWRHLGAADVFVAHVGGRSFGRQKTILAARNGRLLERMHPGYDALVQAFIADDPLLTARRRLDLARWAAEEPEPRPPAVLLITLSGRGGVARFVAERVAALRAEGRRVLRLTPETGEDPDAPPDDEDENDEGAIPADPPERRCRIEVADRPELRDLVFRTRGEFEDLVTVLRQAGTVAVEIHHTLGHDPAVLGLAARLGVPYDITVHDYGLICPRVNLVDGNGRYCGEPDLAACERCTADPEARPDPALTATALLRRTNALVAG